MAFILYVHFAYNKEYSFMLFYSMIFSCFTFSLTYLVLIIFRISSVVSSSKNNTTIRALIIVLQSKNSHLTINDTFVHCVNTCIFVVIVAVVDLDIENKGMPYLRVG